MFFGKAQMPPQTGWSHFTNDPWATRQQKQEVVQVVEEDEFAMLREAAGRQDLKFSVSRGVIRVGRAQFAETEQGVNEAWSYLGGAA